jgi:hypothetical protein
MVTLTVPAEDVIVIVAFAVLLGSLIDVAVSVAPELAGTDAGAVYVTVVGVCPDNAPQTGAQLLPDWVRVQATPWLAGSFVTDAANCCALETFSEALDGEMLTETGGVSVIVALAFFVLFETAVAVRVTEAGLGKLFGDR